MLCLPSLRLLRTKFPGCVFSGLGKINHLRLAKEFSLCDKMLDCESARFTYFFENGLLSPEIEDFDSAILWIKDPEAAADSLSKRSCNVLSIDPFRETKSHPGLEYFRKISDFFLPGSNPDIEDFFMDSEKNLPVDMGRVLIHPGSGSKNKNLPSYFYLKLGELLEKRGLRCDYLFGPVEIEKKEHLIYPEGKRVIPSDCVELKKNIIASSLFIGNDSGPGHLAGFCGIKTISIFLNSLPERWRPLGKNVEVELIYDYKSLEEAIISIGKRAETLTSRNIS